MKRSVIVWVTRAVLAAILLAAGWPKATDPGGFIRDIWNFHLLPEGWAFWIAALVPYVEIACAVALITGRQRQGAHVITGGLLVVFLVFHASAWARGLDTACGCFGSRPPGGEALHPAWWLALIAGMAIALLVSIRAEAATRVDPEKAHADPASPRTDASAVS